MSRWTELDRHEDDGVASSPGSRGGASGSPEPLAQREGDLRARSETPGRAEAAARDDDRRPVAGRGRSYVLSPSEIETLATIGSFRVIPEDQLAVSGSPPVTRSPNLVRLASAGLVERREIVVNQQPVRVCALTREGKVLVDAHQSARPRSRPQIYHAGLVKPREMAHDAQVHRLFLAESERIQAAGGTVTRVVLDYELKRDYQAYLNRRDRPAHASAEEDRRAFAEQAQLALVDGRLALPDLRIEYETPDGTLAYRDVELVTEHYSCSQLAGKAAAGFSLYRSGGGGTTGIGGTPFDPHHLEWLG